DRPDGPVDAVRTQALEQLERSRPEHLELGEARLVEERGRLTDRPRLHLDRRRPVFPGPPARPERLVAAGRVRLVPVDALPAALLAERGAALRVPNVRGRDAERPPRAPLLARVLDVVVLRERLVGAGERVRPIPVVAAEPTQVERPHIPLRVTVD